MSETASTTGEGANTTVPVPVAEGTSLRRGVSTQGPDNVIGPPLPKGSYPADAQCAGGTVVEGSARNFWWVRIHTSQGTGWVSAVRILEGGNDQPIPHVDLKPTVQADP